MKAGDTVQIAYVDGIRHWIYATVVTPNEDGSALVVIQHPGNSEHNVMKFVTKAQIRTKADAEAELANVKPAPGEHMDSFRKRQLSVMAQIDRLSEED